MRTLRVTRASALILAVLIPLGTPTTGADGAPDGQEPPCMPESMHLCACHLVTEAEVETVFDRPVTEQTATTSVEGLHICAYDVQVGPPEGVMAVLAPDADWQRDVARFEGRSVDGLGDEALWVEDEPPGLWVRLGDDVLGVVVWSSTLEIEETAIDFARTAIDRLGSERPLVDACAQELKRCEGEARPSPDS